MLPKTKKAIIICYAIAMFGVMVMVLSRMLPAKIAEAILGLGAVIVIAGVYIPIIKNTWALVGWALLEISFLLIKFWSQDQINRDLAMLPILIVAFCLIVSAITTIAGVFKKRTKS